TTPDAYLASNPLVLGRDLATLGGMHLRAIGRPSAACPTPALADGRQTRLRAHAPDAIERIRRAAWLALGLGLAAGGCGSKSPVAQTSRGVDDDKPAPIEAQTARVAPRL